MLFADLVQVHVDYLAPLEVLVVKGANHVVCLGHCWQELLLRDLDISAMTQRLICLVFLVLSACRLHSFRSHLPKHSLFVLI